MPEALKPLKWYRNLASRKGRLEAGAFLVEGERAIHQIISIHPAAVLEILSVAEPPPSFRNYLFRSIKESQLEYVSAARTPPGILAVVQAPPDIYSASLPRRTGNRILLLEDIQDPGNAGTLIRTASAFGYSGVLMSEKCADPLSPKCVQSTAGSVLSLWIRRTAAFLKLAADLKTAGYNLAAAALEGSEELSVLKQADKLVLALGNEGGGLSEGLLNVADYRLRVPIDSNKAESLNVAACGAICMYLSAPKTAGG